MSIQFEIDELEERIAPSTMAFSATGTGSDAAAAGPMTAQSTDPVPYPIHLVWTPQHTVVEAG